ncbi:MAG TPA: hypothetical protein VFF15_05575 [Flavobacteriaceae bacterium]|nr:hypothetical protein [Flavobacteriaceae bacterium]
MKYTTALLLFCVGFLAFSQESANYRTKTVAVSDSIVIDSLSLNPNWFILQTKNNITLDTSYYEINFSKAILKFKKPVNSDSVKISYLRFPDFLTRQYKQLDENRIVNRTGLTQKLYKLSQSNTSENFVPFSGLNTSGSISRGVTIGNNQNAVLNSELDLQITGKLSDKVSLRASIQDANIPLQEGGYSQRLDEFDQVFVELFSDSWYIRAGDIDLQNTQSYFASFSKRVQGVSLWAKLGSEQNTEVFASGALVRGQFASSQFTAQEGNQGPYKLRGPNGELFVLIVSGSETVYVNGIALERGETKDYIIDYNAGEILFNATYPINSEMRIRVDYQYTDRNYSRIVAYGGGSYTTETFALHASVYNENDAKNQPLQQNLSSEQVDILSEAGDDKTQMTAPSATPESFNENRILYKKELVNGVEVFVFSNNPEDELFSVTFTQVGPNQGNYIISSSNAISNIYEYVEPQAGVPQGNYEPVVQLIAPTKLQIATINGRYTPSEKTRLTFELAGSKNDLNLFSGLDDNDNNGFASKLALEQFLIKKDSAWSLSTAIDMNFIEKNFRNIQGLYNPEFGRDWNLDPRYGSQLISDYGNQFYATGGLTLIHPEKGAVSYKLERLHFSENTEGNRHILSGEVKLNSWMIRSHSSVMNSETATTTSKFTRTHNHISFGLKKAWIGGKFSAEDNLQTNTQTQEITPLSQRFKSYEAMAGYGDSTQVFVETGYKFRVNDSIQNNQLKKVNTSNTFFMDSRLVKNELSNLSIYLNYRTLKFEDETKANENALNSRVQYNQLFLDKIVQWNTVFETQSGTLPQQDFTYIEVEPGQGTYTWIDYNNNGIQELEEFEVAQFQDQGSYVRVLLPNQIFIKTHQNRLSQTLTLNPQQGSVSDSKDKPFWSHFYNQTSYLVDRKVRREGNAFNLNPFKTDEKNQLGLQLNFRNVLFFNRGKQRYTTSYTYLNNHTRSVLSVGFIENNLKSHQLNFNHKFAKSWVINMTSRLDNNQSTSENFSSKNFNLDEVSLFPKLSYLFNDNTRFDMFYQLKSKDNRIANFESLKQHKYGLSLSTAKNQKAALNLEVNYITNAFDGAANTPVSYQMLEGLQPGKNFTWSLLAQQKLTAFLDLNLTYYGRKTESSKTIHSGTIQLKAYF